MKTMSVNLSKGILEHVKCEIYPPERFVIEKVHIEQSGRNKNYRFVVLDVYNKELGKVAIPLFPPATLNEVSKKEFSPQSTISISRVVVTLPTSVSVYQLYDYNDALCGNCELRQVYDLKIPVKPVNKFCCYIRTCFDNETGELFELDDPNNSVQSCFNHFYNIKLQSKRGEFFPQ